MTALFHQTMTALERSLTCGLIASDLDLKHGVEPFLASDEDILDQAMQHRYSRSRSVTTLKGARSRLPMSPLSI
jgi:hypothetical protein